MPFILGANTLSTGAYEVANSCRFQDSDSSEMSRSIGSTGSNTTWTVSAWVKRVELGQSSPIFGTGDGNANNDARMVFFDADDKIECSYYNSGYTYEVTTNRIFRDISAWYHICILFDTTESTAADRVKIYVNGTKETSFATSSYPSEDASFNFGNTSYSHFVNDMGGRNIRGSHYIAELVYLDGTALAVTNFGEFDSDSPRIWKPKDVSGLSSSKGVNGFYMDFEDSSNLGNDVWGGTDFTESNLDAQNQTTDTCTNNFNVINPLYLAASNYTLTEGNLSVDGNASSAWRSLYTTTPLTSGKWYFEVKIDAHNSTDLNNFIIGIVSIDQLDQTSSNGKFFGTAQGYGYHAKDGKKLNNDTVTANGASYGASFSTGNIIGVFLDLDNHKLYFSKDGVVQASGDPTSGSSGTNAAFSITTGHTYVPCIANYYTEEQYSFNFGNPVESLSSAQNDSNGYGSFEYATQGYYSICTKNLAEFGG